MHLLYTIFIGLIIGAVAKLLMPGRDPGGFIVTILLGIAGSVVAGYIGRALHLYREGQAAGFLASIVGAILLLVAYRAVIGNSESAG
ncbi:GlsB/YeaQ/YmgE family stress response membrane protein [Acetobacter farinalis]|uniref:GlsB/YeaQ/YmgE family stress response membrane protein n=1 Tax=Acetobacter farinalis TaxID=1260984 RepID=A0ABT3Q7G3_9PROT|nr:GlsB/YeaQ/YmgE family stress response membrane protein [Acetobacter farinalis]MCX2561238.1 GlsB/YeaQ/YmgE family stress response membrane protein [Acetobacter farinalis]NHO29792.1 GlsB/YeaQ/YmgE family stress response membrane protein [Acetobacter farinalis]